MQPGASGNAAVTVLLDGKPVGEARGADVGRDSVARFDRSGMLRLVAGASRRRHVLTLVATDPQHRYASACPRKSRYLPVVSGVTQF